MGLLTPAAVLTFLDCLGLAFLIRGGDAAASASALLTSEAWPSFTARRVLWRPSTMLMVVSSPGVGPFGKRWKEQRHDRRKFGGMLWCLLLFTAGM